MIPGIRHRARASYAAPMSTARLSSAPSAWLVASFSALVAACVTPVPEAPAPPPPQGPVLHARPTSATLAVGERRAMSLTFRHGAEHVGSLPLGPAATIDDPTIAEIDGSAIVGLAPGATTLHLAHDAPPLSGSVDVPIVVTDASPVALAIEPAPRPHVGERIDLRAVLSYADGTSADVTLDAAWSTPTPGRLHVVDAGADALEARGAAVALGPKPARLFAHLGELEASTEIRPLDLEPVVLEVRLAWAWGDRRRFGAYARFADGAERDVSAGCLWRVDAGAPFRGLDRPQHGPWVRTSELAWNRVATCELSTSRATGVLFGE